ncbi:MAG: DM13 domain-containing protein [Chloroflexota bacterium]
MKNKNLLYLGIILAVAIGLPVAYYLLSPLWVNVEVDESFPTAMPADVSVRATQAMSTAMAEPAKMMEEAMPEANMTLLAQGSFYDIIHVGSGQALFYQLADGTRILRLQDFEVDNGPELHVYLVPIDPVPASIGVEIEGAVDLGFLKGNIGDQNYEIPADLDLSQFKSVVIWCQPFRVPFIAAPLTVQ